MDLFSREGDTTYEKGEIGEKLCDVFQYLQIVSLAEVVTSVDSAFTEFFFDTEKFVIPIRREFVNERP
jgi:hypothetical protein